MDSILPYMSNVHIISIKVGLESHTTFQEINRKQTFRLSSEFVSRTLFQEVTVI